jgi:molecular chaperone GrpE
MAEQEKSGSVEADAQTASGDSSVENAETDISSDENVGDEIETGDKEEMTEGDDPAEALRLRVKELEEENTELKNQYLRKQADLENYRKRMVRDKENAVQFSNQQILLDMTTIIDDFERAIRSAEESRDYDSFHDGIVLIENQLTGMLERKWGLKRFDSEGDVFDPQKHEAVTTEPREDHTESVVLEDYQKGYMLHDRVLRPAKVKVSMPAGDTE